jgi:hypothetical protein
MALSQIVGHVPVICNNNKYFLVNRYKVSKKEQIFTGIVIKHQNMGKLDKNRVKNEDLKHFYCEIGNFKNLFCTFVQ